MKNRYRSRWGRHAKMGTRALHYHNDDIVHPGYRSKKGMAAYRLKNRGVLTWGEVLMCVLANIMFLGKTELGRHACTSAVSRHSCTKQTDDLNSRQSTGSLQILSVYQNGRCSKLHRLCTLKSPESVRLAISVFYNWEFPHFHMTFMSTTGVINRIDSGILQKKSRVDSACYLCCFDGWNFQMY